MQEVRVLLNKYLKTNNEYYLNKYLLEINKRDDIPNKSELLLEKIGNKTVLELMIYKKIKIEKIVNDIILENEELLIIALLNNYTNMLINANEDVFFKKINEITIFEYLLKNNLLNIEHINKIKNHKEIYDILIKSNKEFYLEGLSNNMLHQKINDKYIMKELLDIGIIPIQYEIKDIELIDELLKDNQYEYLENISKEYINYIIPGTNKTLLEFLLENNLTCYAAVDEINKNTNNSKYIYNTICKYNRLDVLLNLNENALLNKFDSNETILEKLLDNGMTPNIQVYVKTETINILLNKKMYSELKKCTEELLLLKLNSGKRIFELLLKQKLSFNAINIDSDLITRSIFELKRYDLIKCLSAKSLLTKYNLQYTYLDMVLKEIKKNNNIITRKELNIILNKTKDRKEIAQIYLIHAKYNMLNQLKKLTKEDLLNEINGMTLLEALLEEDKITSIEKIIPNNLLSDAEISIVLKLYGIKQKKIKYENDFTKDIVSEYLIKTNQEYDKLPISEEANELLNELYNVMNDGKSDPELIDLLIKSYRFLLSTNSGHSYEIYHLIDIKKNNPEFCYKKTDAGAHFNISDKYIALSNNNINTLLHETTHALYYFLTTRMVPLDFEKIINDLKINPVQLFQTNSYSKKYQKIKSNISHNVEKIYMKDFDKSITEETRVEIEEFLNLLKSNIKEKYIKHGYSEDIIDIILNSDHTVDEYIEQNRKIKKQEMMDIIIRVEYGAFIAIGDFLDAIYGGKFHDGKLFIIPGKKITGAYGHGIEYYKQGVGFIFEEMLANYGTIIKSKNSNKNIERLKYYIGDELVELLERYYRNEILLSQKYVMKSSKIR